MYVIVLKRVMATASSSSSRTILDHRPDKQALQEDDAESSINLDGLEIPNLNLCDSFDFMNEDILTDVNGNEGNSPPLSPSIVAYRANVVRESLELGVKEFPEGCNLGYLSHYINHDVNWSKVKN